MKLRFYVNVDENLRRLPLGVIEERLAVPQLAKTRQKFVQVTYEWRGGLVFLDANGFYLNFDDYGVAYVSNKNLRAAMEVTSLADKIARERLERPRVASIYLRKQKKELASEIGWAVPAADVDLIKADLMGGLRPAGTSAIPMIKAVRFDRC